MDVTVYNYIDLSYMEMMADGDDSMKKIMLDMLVEELPLEIEKLETFCTSADWQEANAVSHKLKSTLAFVGNEEMTNINKQIELATKNEDDLDAIINWVQKLNSICPKVMEELQQEAAKY
jgi:HPt (histidine-containing phosphotransfer) domain-containing protein